MIATLEDFIDEFEKIKEMGWIQTHRAGPTGVGKTLEDLLGICENNKDEPDFGEYELKSTRVDSQSMLTMFTRAPKPRGVNSKLRNEYGYYSFNSKYSEVEKVLHTTLSVKDYTNIADSGKKLKILCKEDRICIVSESGEEKAYWDKTLLKKSYQKKYKNKFVYVKAQSQGIENDESFKFIEAYEISGFDYDSFFKLINEGGIYIDVRIGQYHTGKNKGKAHDHGTGFRIRENDQPLLFTNVKRIDIHD